MLQQSEEHEYPISFLSILPPREDDDQTRRSFLKSLPLEKNSKVVVRVERFIFIL